MYRLSYQVFNSQQCLFLHTTCSSFARKEKSSFYKKGLVSKGKTDSNEKPDYINVLKEADKAIKNRSQFLLSKSLKDLTQSIVNRKKDVKIPFTLNPKPPLIDINECTSPLAKLFIQPVRNDVDELLGVVNDLSLSNDDLKRVYLYQTCLEHEVPFRSELPLNATEQNFLKQPQLWEERSFQTVPVPEPSFHFAMHKWALKNLAKRKKAKRASRKAEQTNVEVAEDRLISCLLPRYTKSHLQSWNINKWATSYHFNQPLIFDMRFHNEMSGATSSFMLQMQIALLSNFTSLCPFHLIFCNFNRNTDFYRNVWSSRVNPCLENACTFSEKSLSQLEPLVSVEDMVYLSPDANNVMTEFSPHKTYIIGGLVDRHITETKRTATISRAEGISHEKLPLHLYLKWGGVGGKMELSVNVVFNILITLKHTGCWIKALSHIPYRLHSGLSDLGQELANYDPQIIEKFDSGRQWKMNKEKKSRSIQMQDYQSVVLKRPGSYFGKH